MATTERIHITLPTQTLAQLRQAAEAERRSDSNMASIAIEQYLAQRAATTGESRLRDLERLSNQHQGAQVKTADETINKTLAAEAKLPAPCVSPPNRSHMTVQERRDANDSFLRTHPNGTLVGGK